MSDDRTKFLEDVLEEVCKTVKAQQTAISDIMTNMHIFIEHISNLKKRVKELEDMQTHNKMMWN